MPSLTQDSRFGSQTDQQTDKESNPRGYNSIGTKCVDYGLGGNPNLAPDGTRFYKNVPGDISEFRGLKAPSLRGTSSYSSFSRVVRFAASTKQGTDMSGRPSARCWRYFDSRYGIVPHLERSHRGMPFESVSGIDVNSFRRCENDPGFAATTTHLLFLGLRPNSHVTSRHGSGSIKTA